MMKINQNKSDLFMRGFAHVKFIAIKNEKDSKLVSFNKFDLVRFYDIVIDNIEEIELSKYRQAEFSLRAPDKTNHCKIQFQKNLYTVELIDFKIVNKPKILHEQTNDDELYGEYELVEVFFKIPKESSLKSTISTGNRKKDNGVLYEEYYTKGGEIEWKAIRAIKGKATGRVQYKNNQYRNERFQSDGSAYWDNWVDKKDFKIPLNLKTGPTGLKRKVKGVFQRQVLTDDQQFIWIKDNNPEKIDVFATVFVVLLMSLLVIFCIYLSQKFEGKVVYYIILPMAICFLIGAPLINYLFKTAKRMKTIFIQMNWILITLTITIMVIYSFSQLIVGAVGSYCQNITYKKPNSTKNENPIIQTNNDIKLVYFWTDNLNNKKNKYRVTYAINKKDICKCAESFDELNSKDIKDRYIVLIQKADDNLKKQKEIIISSIHKQHPKTVNNQIEFLNAIASFSQSRVHKTNVENDLISPAHFLLGIDDKDAISFSADCDERTLATFFLLKDYDQLSVAIFNYDDSTEHKHHSMLGICLTNDDDVADEYATNFIKIKEKKYFLWEMTAKKTIGWINDKYQNLEKWELKLDENDFKEE